MNDETLYQMLALIPAFVGLVIIPLTVIPLWRIFRRAGFAGWLALIVPVPLVGLVVLYYVAYRPWGVVPKSEVLVRQTVV